MGNIGRSQIDILKALNYKPNVYKGSCRALDNAIRKYGSKNFGKTVKSMRRK